MEALPVAVVVSPELFSSFLHAVKTAKTAIIANDLLIIDFIFLNFNSYFFIFL
jgi:hypothetical protein